MGTLAWALTLRQSSDPGQRLPSSRRHEHVCDIEQQVKALARVRLVGKRDDFTSRFIEQEASGGIPMATIDWDPAMTALNVGELPSRPGSASSWRQRRASPVDLRDTVTGLDARNLQRLITAISHAAGQRPGSRRS
jgi:hypothetical protein